MKKIMIGLLLASAAVATPAQARDGSWYAGIEGGALWAKDIKSNFSSDYSFFGLTGGDGSALFTGTTDFEGRIDHSTGTDVDLIGGYDFGMFRAELELGYKHATHKRYQTNANGVPDYYNVDNNFYANFYDLNTTSEGYGKTDVYSAMVNLLFDVGNQDGFSFYAGPGVGLASTRIKIQDRAYESDFGSSTLKDSGLALQGIAGVRYAVSTNLDFGLKYRYFYGNKINDDIDVFDNNVDINLSRFRSHSLLASLVYNFASPPPPVVEIVAPAPLPEPEPVVQMQTCYDGSMIPVTAMCPQPPQPVVTPAPTPGERG